MARQKKPVLGIFRMSPDAKLPHQATEQSACMDLYSHLKPGTTVKVFRADNTAEDVQVRTTSEGVSGIVLNPGDRALVPTGLIFDIPAGYSLRAHPRSGLSLKNALTLINGEGVIDSDYVNQSMVPLVNHSTVRQFLEDGERTCQIEMVKDLDYSITEIQDAPGQKTSRTGGFGHSGKN